MPQRPTQFKRLALVVRVWLVPVTLVVVSMIHMNQWSQTGRSSWGTGAGFGMFATVDYHGTRFFRCHGDTSLGRMRIELSPEVAKKSCLVAKAIPTENNLRAVIKQLSQQAWYVHVDEDGDSYLTVQKSDSQPEPVSVNGIVLEVWGLEIEAEARQLKSFKINESSTIQGVNHVARR